MSADQQPRNLEPVAKVPGGFLPGDDPRRSRSGGRPKALAEIERMLDAEHRTVDNMREVFTRLKSLALDDVTRVFVNKKGEAHESTEQPDPAFLRLYLDRVLGPVKELNVDLTNAPEPVVEWFAENLRQ